MQFLLLMASNPAKFPPNTVLCFSLKKRKGENKLNKMDNFQFLEIFPQVSWTLWHRFDRKHYRL